MFIQPNLDKKNVLSSQLIRHYTVRYVCIGYLTEMYEMRTHCDTYEMPVGFY